MARVIGTGEHYQEFDTVQFEIVATFSDEETGEANCTTLLEFTDFTEALNTYEHLTKDEPEVDDYIKEVLPKGFIIDDLESIYLNVTLWNYGIMSKEITINTCPIYVEKEV